MMNKFYQVIIFLLAISVAACTSAPSNMTLAGNDEDQDIGLGGTGMTASSGSGLGGTGMSGTGVLGTITGFGSIFVNGIEIEYDDETVFTVDGEAAELQSLVIGDVVEVLTTDDKTYTQAKMINLRHEVIGRVESVEPQMYSFTVNGQSIVQPVNTVALPEPGTTVAVSGFRIDEQTILATRVSPAAEKQHLLRLHTELPFKGKTTRWLVQTHVRDDKALFELDGVTQAVKLEQKSDKSLNDRLGIKILKLQKPAEGQLQLDREIDPVSLPRGRQAPAAVKQPGDNMLPGATPGSLPGAVPGSAPRSIQDAMPGPGEGAQSGSIRNLKR